jgi:hypothetical protein
VLVVYLVLGILYESFIHPLTILSGLPSAALGALITLLVFGVDLSLYAFVGVIMLIGIVKKNAIMMIDFALDRQRNEKMPAREAIFQACLIRFRPIMMTTMAAWSARCPSPPAGAPAPKSGSRSAWPSSADCCSRKCSPVPDAGHLSLPRPLHAQGTGSACRFRNRLTE